MPRALKALLPVALTLLGSGCGQPTEIVVQLQLAGAAPPIIRVELRRSTPFPAPAPLTPLYVNASLGLHGSLDLDVTPQGGSTLLSLLPTKDGPLDLNIAVSVPEGGHAVTPSTPQAMMFVDGKSQTVTFSIEEVIPDMAMPPAKDGGARDGGNRDGGPSDAAAPKG